MTEKVTDSKSLWAWVPAGLLGSMLAGLGVMTYMATDDPHFALEPNYYDKAVHWDRAQRDQRASEASGLTAELSPLHVNSDGRAEVRVRLVDREQRAVTGAQIQIEAFPNAYAARVVRMDLREAEPGVYVGSLERPTLGLWELRLQARAGEARLRQVLRRDVIKQVKA